MTRNLSNSDSPLLNTESDKVVELHYKQAHNLIPKPEPSTELKNYQIKTKDASSWTDIHSKLITFGTTDSSIPQRTCSCSNYRGHSATTGTYQISEVEAIELRKNPNVEYISLDPEFHEEARIEIQPLDTINRFGKNVKNYRNLASSATGATAGATEVANSLVATGAGSATGTSNWVKVSDSHTNSNGITYWSQISSLLMDYAVYPSVPANVSTPDPLRNTLQEGSNTFTLAGSGWYKIEVVADGEEAYLEILDNTNNWYDQKPGILLPKDPRNRGHFFDIIQLGYKTAGTSLTLNYKVKNGNWNTPSEESWNKNPGGIGWRVMFQALSAPDTVQSMRYAFPNTPTNAEDNRTGWQSLRTGPSGTNPFGSDPHTVVNSDVTYQDDGTDVDLIVVDSGTWAGHPEFCTNNKDPQNFIPGNVLSRSGTSGVLDLILDAPYYLDPDYFDSSASYLETRWDGTVVPTESAARAWWSSPSNRSDTYKNAYPMMQDTSLTIASSYTRAAHSGTDEAFPTSDADHGTKCGSLAYGKNFGRAFNCNKWSLCLFGAVPAATLWEIQKIFHQTKPDNPKFSGSSAKNKTVSTNSWGQRQDLGPFVVGSSNYKVNYQGTETTYTWQQKDIYGNTVGPMPPPGQGNSYAEDALASTNPWTASVPACLRGSDTNSTQAIGYYSMGYYWKLHPNQKKEDNWGDRAAEYNAAIEAMNSGIHFVFAAGNDSNYWADKDNVNYNNWVSREDGTGIPGDGSQDGKYYFHRACYPSAIGYESTGLNDVFTIGALDDEYMNRPDFSDDTSFVDYGPNSQSGTTETMARSGPANNLRTDWYWGYGGPRYSPGYTYQESGILLHRDRFAGWANHGRWNRRIDYSTRGDYVDYWAPADSTLAAAGNSITINNSGEDGSFSITRNDPKPSSFSASQAYLDGFMNGTSAASPVAAGVIACHLQQNRTTAPKHLKGYLNSNIADDTNVYKGVTPDGANDPLWNQHYGNMGHGIKVIRELPEGTKHNNTPNPCYTASSGIDATRNLNERYTVTSASGVTIMIRGIKEFSSSDVSIPATLRVKNGYYPVYTTHDMTSTQRGLVKFRIKSGSNDQILEVSDDGGSSYNYFTVRVVSGNFVISRQGLIYYYLNKPNEYEIEVEDETPTYIISTNSQSYNEGQQIITSVQASGIPSGTILYWSLSGTGITSGDFSSGSLTGQVSIIDGWQTTFGPAYTVSPVYRVRLDVASGVYTFTANYVDVGTNTTGNPIEVGSGVGAKRYTMGDEVVDAGTAKIYKIKVEEYFGLSGTFNHTLANDLTTEGTETVAIKLFSDSSRNTQIATTSATINDTSKGSTYAIVPSNTSVDEGSTMGYGVGTSNVADGTTLYWSLSGTNITADDFSPSGLTGSGTISNNSFSVTRTVANDLKTEGVETVVFKLFTDSARTNEVASNSTVKIQDTSITPAGPGYTITPNKTTLDEGDQIIFTVATTNVAENTTLHWQVLADTGNVDANDFGSGEFAGSDQISSGGFTITQNVANDATTEGAEKYTIVLYPDNTYDWPSRLAQSALVTINDTSVSASTYVISPSPAQLDEGGTFTTTVNTTYVDEGTVLYWRLEGSGIDANDFSSGSLTGSGTVNALGTFNFSHTVANDTTTESEEQINICLYGDSARTIKLAETGVIVNDTSQSPTPTYVIQPDKLEYVEGDAVSVKFITSGVAAGTTLHWKMVPTGTNPIDDGGGGGTNGTDNSADFDIGPGMWGSANVQTPAPGVTNDGFGYSWVCNQDQLTEGDETFKIEMYTAHSGGTGGTWSGLLATSPVCTIKDTSTAPGASTYTLTANTNPINEGDYLGLTVTTTNVANGTVLYWEYSGVTSGDLEDGALQGSVTIPPEATKSWGTTIKADTLTEGSETLAVKLYSDSARTTQVGSTLNITINDTSIGSEPTYVLSTTDTRFNEGDSFTTTVTTTNVADNTVLYWRLSGTGISEDDFNLANTVTGSGTITSNTFTFSHTIKEDVTTEGDEVISIKLYSDSNRTTQVGNTLSVTMRDTSQPGYNIRVTAPNNNEYIITGTDRNGSI